MLVDANLLIYAVDRSSPSHGPAADWLNEVLSGEQRVGLPWQTIGAFVRIMTHPRVTTNPLSGDQAWAYVRAWLATDVAWIPPATERTARVLLGITEQLMVTANLVPDAQLAALAIEHGLEMHSTDGDFARFEGVVGFRWRNPLR